MDTERLTTLQRGQLQASEQHGQNRRAEIDSLAAQIRRMEKEPTRPPVTQRIAELKRQLHAAEKALDEHGKHHSALVYRISAEQSALLSGVAS